MAVASSCREVSCLVRQRSRPAFLVANSQELSTLGRLPSIRRRKERATAGQYAPILRATRELQWQVQWVSTPKGEGNPESLS